jgi:hypothetical protein
MGWHPLFVLTTRDSTELGVAILETLDAFEENVPHPITWAGIDNAMLKAAGVKSRKKFFECAKCVVVDRDDSSLVFRPLKNEGARMGFVPIDVRVPSTAVDPSECGRSFLIAVSEAR